MILAGDIGGTKTRLAIFNEKGEVQREEKFASQQFSSLTEVLKLFFQGKEKVDAACFGIAGPVCERKCKTTNIPWMVSADDLEKEMKIGRVDLINDLEANAWGLKLLKPEEFFVVNEGKKVAGNQALISAGTGLGEAGIYWDGKDHHPFACEGGHCDFGPINEEQLDLLVYLMKKFGHVSYERIVSGMGLVDLYRFLIDTKREKPNPEVDRAMQETDPAKVITENGVNGKCLVCKRACQLFISVYGNEASNLALKFLSVGGLFLGGGVAPRLLTFFKTGAFMEAFLYKGRFRNFLSNIPVKIILNDKAALLGAFRFALERE